MNTDQLQLQIITLVAGHFMATDPEGVELVRDIRKIYDSHLQAIKEAVEFEDTLKSQLSRAYYSGLDHKGWSAYEEKDAIDQCKAALTKGFGE